MRALRMVTRAARRRQLGGLVVVALVVGIAGGAVLAAAAGARRTASALDRFRTDSLAADVELDISAATPAQVAELARDPSVDRLAWGRQVMLAPEGTGPEGGFLPAVAAVDLGFGRDLDRPRVLEGRRADPDAPHQIEIGRAFATQSDLAVGDSFTLDSYAPDQLEAGARGEEVGAPAGPTVRFRVVGIVQRPFDLGVTGTNGGILIATPAFHERFEDSIGGFVDALLRVRARDGQAGVPDVVRAARAIFGEELFQVIGVTEESAGVGDAADVVANALWIFVVIASLATATAASIIVFRQLATEEADQATLAAMGMTRRERALANAAVLAPSSVAGGLTAAVVAAALSPLLPFGIARQAEPDPGLELDARVLGLGCVAIVAGVLLVGMLAGWRVAGAATRSRREWSATKPTLAARVAGGTGASPALSTGARFAFEPGHGAGAVPVRTALLGTTLGVAGVTAALVFGAGLTHLAGTPRLYGWGWDAVLETRASIAAGPSGRCTDTESPFADDPALRSVGALCIEAVEVEGRPATGWFLESERGSVVPVVVDGRPPQVDDEVVLGSATLDAVGKDVGDTVRIRGERTHRFRIVGRGVLPHLGPEDTDAIDEGALFNGPAITALFEPVSAPNRYLIGSFAEGAGPAPGARGTALLRDGRASLPEPPAEVDRLTQVGELPAVLAGLFALLAVVSVGHVVLVGIRRRRHDLAVLRAMGFARRDVRAAIGYQATLVGTVGLVVGVPVGIVAGRAVWTAVADSIGAVPAIVVPWTGLALTALATVVIVNVIGAVGAHAALRDRPAAVLATE